MNKSDPKDALMPKKSKRTYRLFGTGENAEGRTNQLPRVPWLWKGCYSPWKKKSVFEPLEVFAAAVGIHSAKTCKMGYKYKEK